MLSLMSSTAIQPPRSHLSEAIISEPLVGECSQDVTKFNSPAEATESLLKLVMATVDPSSSVTVRVNLPSWTTGGLDLYDLRDHHARSLAFVHSFVNVLRANNINATYKLTVSNATSYTLLRPTVDDSTSPQTEMNRLCAKLNNIIVSSSVERECAYLTTISDVPALIIT
ncbi:hypothetical protein FRC03_000604 [Tulasnella sp. 419]|nr:hypothetical protein FRC02_005677 [Tulasnella sp. 418]KAG8969778.1 hypothetical protein FRC03_000604 [Tulasnella sp. 419]